MTYQRFFVAILLLLTLLTACKESKPVNTLPTPKIQAWTFPSDRTCDATNDITDPTRHYDALKPQYYALQDDGTLQQQITGCNAYSPANVALAKQHSAQQYTTVSGSIAGMNALTSSKALTSTFVSTMLSFLQTSGFTGVEIDFEDFAQWSPQQYNAYKTFLVALGNALHAQGYKLMIDGPAISDSTYQSYYQFKYEDMNALPIDAIVAMAYDQQNDNGAGTPVSSLAWINNICQWMLSKINDHNRIIIGLNSYGYMGRQGAYTVTKQTYQQSSQMPGFSTATRDASSGEMTWTSGNMFYDYSDSTSLNLKLQTVLNSGISNVSIWHLGGGNAFPAQAPQPTPTPTPQPSALTLTADQVKTIYNALTPDQINTIKRAISS